MHMKIVNETREDGQDQKGRAMKENQKCGGESICWHRWEDEICNCFVFPVCVCVCINMSSFEPVEGIGGEGVARGVVCFIFFCFICSRIKKGEGQRE